MHPPCILIVRYEQDALADAVAAQMQARGSVVRQLAPSALAGMRLTLAGDVFLIDDHPVAGALFRVAPDTTFSRGFRVEDQAFCDAEVGAVWLAATHLDSVLAINQYDAVAWYEGAGWSVWRRRLLQSGLPLSAFAFGNAAVQGSAFWYPYSTNTVRADPDQVVQRVMACARSSHVGQQTSIVVCKQVITGLRLPDVLLAAEHLAEAGVLIAAITTDADDRLLVVDSQPFVLDIAAAERAAASLVDAYDAHLARW